MENENKKSIGESVKSRRGFIKKTSVVAGIAILPASNVWGTCNVSGVSGGSQNTNSTCVVASFHGGYAPAHWANLLLLSPGATQLKALTDMVHDIATDTAFDTGVNKASYYYPSISDIMATYRVDVTGGGKIPSLHINARDALLSGTANQKRIAAVYMNIVLGFVRGQPQLGTNGGIKLFLEHIWGSFHAGDPIHTARVVDGSFDHVGTISEVDLLRFLKI